MVNLYNASDRALRLMNEGRFDQVDLEIQTSKTHKKYIFLAKSELPGASVLNMLFQKAVCWMTGLHIEKKETKEIKLHYEKGKTFHAKLNRALEKAKYLGNGLNRIKRSGYKGCIMGKDYWCESIQPHHLSKFTYASLKQIYEKQKPDVDFDTWIRSEAGAEALHEVCGSKDISLAQVVQMRPEERKLHQVTVRNINGENFLYFRGAPLDTKKMCPSKIYRMMSETGIDEIDVGGKAIFVIGPDHNIYVGTHEVGHFHHSSFLAGKPVISAGEITTDKEGRILEITDSSGHYKPHQKNVLDGLDVLRKKGIDLVNVIYISTPREAYLGGRFNASDYLDKRGHSDRKPLEVKDTI